jgi:DNA segregation ATPase FtsK/SpoIIIE-like protein
MSLPSKTALPALPALPVLAALASTAAAAALATSISMHRRRKNALPEFLDHPGLDSRWDRVLLGRCADGTQADLRFGYTKPHTLIVGPAGGGKSVVLRNFLNHALTHPDDWNIVGIDFKIVEFGWLKRHDNTTVVSTFETAVEVLEQAVADMHAVYQRMEDAGVNNSRDLRNPPKATMIVLDEVGFLQLDPRTDKFAEADNALRTKIVNLLNEIGRLGRGTNIRLVLATQCLTPEVVLGGELLANIPTRILMDHTNPHLSQQLFDHDYTTDGPRVRGRGIIGSYGVADVFQTYFIPPDWQRTQP